MNAKPYIKRGSEILRSWLQRSRQVAIFQPFHHAHALSSFVAINYSVIKAERQC